MADPDYFTLTEFREQMPDMSSSTTYSDAKVLAAAAFFTTIVERETGRSFVLRSRTETLNGSGTDVLLLKHLPIDSVTSITVGGVSVDTSLVGFTDGMLRYVTTAGYGAGTPWTRGVGNVVVTYMAGEDSVPDDIKSAVMWATRDRLMSQNNQNAVDVRRTAMTNDLGGTVSYVLPGEKRPTGYPELDALIASYTRTSPSLGFA